MYAPNKAFRIALIISALFHLSMVTVFSIEIPFQRPRLYYHQFDIINPNTLQAVTPEQRGTLRVPDVQDLMHRDANGANGGNSSFASLPKVDLPQLHYAELDRLRLREEGLRLRDRLEAFRKPRAHVNFDEELQRLSDAIFQLPLLNPFEEQKETPQPRIMSRPAPGFAAYVEWLTEPKDRDLIFAPPIPELSTFSPQALRDDPIALPFRVNPDGKVVEVWPGFEDEASAASKVWTTLLKYRFAPLSPDARRDQHGTLFIVPEDTVEAESAPF